MHRIVQTLTLIIFLLVGLCLFSTTAMAGPGNLSLRDSLLTLAPGEPTLQELLDSLGYNINVQIDELGWQVFCAAQGSEVAMILEEVSASASQANSGWYNAADTSQKHQLFSSTSAAGDSVVFAIPSGDSIGFYMTPNLTGYESWHTQTGYNIDQFDHALIFATGQPHEYLIAFEDLKDGGDRDFNDLIIRVRFQNVAPVLILPEDIYDTVCFENTVCIPVVAYDQNCLGDTLTLQMLEGYGTFPTQTGVGRILTQVCFLPWASDSTYRFVFKVTDKSGAFDIDTVLVVYNMNDRPQITLPADFDTLLCERDSICIPVTLFDPNGDPLQVDILEGQGSFNYSNNTFCFLPAAVDQASYTFILKASDECCRAEEKDKPYLFPLPCPEDTITINVKLNLLPILVTIPDFDTSLCMPAQICFPVSATDPNSGDQVTITVAPPATYNSQTGEVCFMADQEKTYNIIVTATDALCGAQVKDTINVTVDLNTPPQLVVANDTTYKFCSTPTEICFNNSVIDPDPDESHAFTLLSGPGTINSATGKVCFLPTGAGNYQFVISVNDRCQVTDIDTVNIGVIINRPPDLTLPDDFSVTQCVFEKICFTGTATDPDLPNDALTFIKVSGFGSINAQTGEICFTPVAAGSYKFVIRVRDLCGLTDQDTINVMVVLNTPPTLIADTPAPISFCQLGDSACITLQATDPDAGEVLTFEQLSGQPGNLNPQTGRFCFLPGSAGNYNFGFGVVDHCGKADSADLVVTILLNAPPVVTLPSDFADSICASGEQICFMPVITDPDNQFTVQVSPIGTYQDDKVCFAANVSHDTTYCLIVRATDDCQAQDEDTICINIHFNRRPLLTMANDTALAICAPPDSFCFSYTATDPDGPAPIIAIVSGHGTLKDGKVCFKTDTAGFYCITLRATDACGAFIEDAACLILSLDKPPVLSVHGDIDTALCGPTQICFNNSATDPDLPNDQLTFTLVNPPSGASIFGDGRVCFTPQSAATFNLIIKVADQCGKFAQDTVKVTVHFNQPPIITASPDSLYLEYCGSSVPPIERCFSGLTISDPDGSISKLVVQKIEGPGTFTPSTLTTCFTAPVVSDTILFVYKVSDTCGAYDLDTIRYYIYVNPDCDTTTCVEVRIEESPCVVTNSQLSLAITAEGEIPFGGFALLIQYDPTAFVLLDVVRGSETQHWEYFTYRTGDVGGCDGPCPDGLVKIWAIADRNNGAEHPAPDDFFLNGPIAYINFHVTNDLNYSGLTYPVNFYWLDCSQNAFSSKSGDSLMVEKIIYNPYGIVWNEFDEVHYPESARFDHVGTPDSCLVGDKTRPHRCLILHSGSICIIHRDSIDTRGDLNLNKIAYEISDAVLYTNYFIYGARVFTINYDGQVAASDVNADGRPLTVGDLVYLIRVLTHDAQPIHRLMPFSESVDLTLDQEPGQIELKTSSVKEIGAAHFTFDISKAGSTPEFRKSEALGNMKFDYSIDGNVMRVLIYNYTRDRIAAGENLLGTIMADGEIELISADFADYDGNDLTINVKSVSSALPTAYELYQNCPNPFNPETEIKLALPEASDWTIDIFNINGQQIKSFSGYSDGGIVTVKFEGADLASGIYFYRATAAKFTATKKMIMIK